MHINWLSFPTPLDHVCRRLNESRLGNRDSDSINWVSQLHVLHTICMDHQFWWEGVFSSPISLKGGNSSISSSRLRRELQAISSLSGQNNKSGNWRL
ncbi:hypothetical protein TNIN_475721 [Trichonephila inaurata madagascariensis]|uniref:Uncharacterized protein n=1 Tax=Trichonephila inaurata madagascariensis TaxID=2747483 RepID=A0A8X6IVF4_9ARAC|nr:hypothetical protein TNIN_475721 [Trichonephila inaurata madagascariensis]